MSAIRSPKDFCAGLIRTLAVRGGKVSDRPTGLRVPQLTGFGEEMQAKGNMPQDIDLVVGKPVSAADLRNAIFTVISRVSAEEPAPVAVPAQPGAAVLC